MRVTYMRNARNEPTPMNNNFVMYERMLQTWSTVQLEEVGYHGQALAPIHLQSSQHTHESLRVPMSRQPGSANR